MNKIAFLGIILLGISFLACAPRSSLTERPVLLERQMQESVSPVKAMWEVEWEKAVAEAKREGKAIIMTTAGSEVRSALSQGFKERYGISTEWVVGKGAEMAAKLSAERRAGIYLVDVYFAGATTQINQLKPWGFLDPLTPLLMLPEVTDASLWVGGKLNFTDRERTYLFPVILYVSASMFTNQEIFKAEEIKSYKDLLIPSLKGKIIMGDPTIPGSALRWFRVVGEKIMGHDFLRALARQEAAIQRDERLVVDWVARGKYLVGIGVKPDPIQEYRNAGAPLRLLTPREGTWLTGGAGVLSAINKPPHPNARKVFINWLLSREGQSIYTRATNTQSARIDINTDFLDSEVVRRPGVSYFITEDEEFLLKELEAIEMAQQIFGPLLKK